jgi:hypothetical protein
MRDSPIATRYDHNHVISLRHYRKGDHVAPPELVVSRDWVCSRPVTVPSLIVREAIVMLLARALQVLMVLLPTTLQVLMLLLPHTIWILILLSSHTLHVLLLPTLPESCKMI